MYLFSKSILFLLDGGMMKLPRKNDINAKISDIRELLENNKILLSEKTAQRNALKDKLHKIIEKSAAKNITEVWPNLELYMHGGVNFGPGHAMYVCACICIF